MTRQPRRPAWLRVDLNTEEDYRRIRKLVGEENLHTVCGEANCPNLHECWNAGTATFLILGDVCTRHCSFCSVGKGRPEPIDKDEPRRVAAAVSAIGCRHAVLTSVDRDDLPDGGAGIWAATIRAISKLDPPVSVEALVPDFGGDTHLLDLVLDESPAVLSHNVETVPELYPRVRTDSDFSRSLAVLSHAAKHGSKPRIKSGMMLGLGETREQVIGVMERLIAHRCEILTLGQYLPPTRRHLPVERFVEPAEFTELKEIGEGLGLRHVEAGPFVRSSYRAETHLHV